MRGIQCLYMFAKVLQTFSGRIPGQRRSPGPMYNLEPFVALLKPGPRPRCRGCLHETRYHDQRKLASVVRPAISCPRVKRLRCGLEVICRRALTAWVPGLESVGSFGAVPWRFPQVWAGSSYELFQSLPQASESSVELECRCLSPANQ